MTHTLTANSFRLKDYICACTTVVVLIINSGCKQNTPPSGAEITAPSSSASTPSSEPQEAPLLLLEDEPLLLEDNVTDAAGEGPVADNTRCFVCHANYLDEKIAVTHARVNIGCVRCHGESDAHIADESWGSGGNGTAPDIMYRKEKINPSCLKCHPRNEIDIPQHKPVFANATKGKVCTDCHGDHRLTVRRCTWK